MQNVEYASNVKPMTYIFYDTETSGVETEFDQILQFAAILTDDDFNELESFEMRCQLMSHIVPSLDGLLVTKIPIATLTDKSLPTHYEFIKKIQKKLLEWSPAIFIGWNSIPFDEELMRHTFFHTLHPAYLTNTNGNKRADVMKIAHAASVYAPKSITIPINNKGNPFFKLKNIALANGYKHDNAHEALADVRMTIQMAKLIKEKAPAIWQNMMNVSKKNDVFDMISKQPMFSLTESNYGRMNHYIVTLCGMNGKIDAIVFDLKYDPDEYKSLSVEALVEVLKGKNNPLRSLKAHRQPILMPVELSTIIETLDITFEELTRRIKTIKEDLAFQTKVQEAFAGKYEDRDEPEHIEQRLYSGGFISREDELLALDFQNAGWEQKLSIVERIKDPCMQEFAYRIIFFENPKLLSTEIYNRLNDWKKTRLLTTDEVPWMTVPKALAQIDEKMASVSQNDSEYVMEIKKFIEDLGNVKNY